MSLSSIPIPLHFRVFNFILYVGYTEQALKGYQGKTIPSVGILNKFRCPVHNRTEFLYGTDIDEPITSLRDVYRQDNCIITKTKYGNHIICNDHIESMSIAQEKIQEYTVKYNGDERWYRIGIDQGYFVWRIYGKYADDPFVRVIKPSNDHVLKLLQQLYDIKPFEYILRKFQVMS